MSEVLTHWYLDDLNELRGLNVTKIRSKVTCKVCIAHLNENKKEVRGVREEFILDQSTHWRHFDHEPIESRFVSDEKTRVTCQICIDYLNAIEAVKTKMLEESKMADTKHWTQVAHLTEILNGEFTCQPSKVTCLTCLEWIEEHPIDLEAMDAVSTPPGFKLKPRNVHNEERIRDIVAAMKRRLSNGHIVPSEWTEEYNDLIKLVRGE